MKSRTHCVQIESLEPRRLLAGVTMLIHGLGGNIGGWVDAAANAIASQIPGTESKYVMKIGKDSAGQFAVTAFDLYEGPALGENDSGEVIIKLDWTISTTVRSTSNQIGAVVSDFLMSRHGSSRALAELPIHLIGHSRGASLCVAISRNLGQHGIWVDQNTYLDPHPVGRGDAAMQVFDNVIFADNYWRTGVNPDGQFVEGALDRDLHDSVEQNHSGLAHVAVTGYYHGTIDLNATGNGESSILSQWYDGSANKPARDEAGFAFSRIKGLRRPSDGVAPAFGGTAERADSGSEVGTQWASIANLRILEGKTIPSGPRASLRFLFADRDGRNEITLFLDRDTNPYNGNNVRTLRRFTINGADDPTSTKVSIPTEAIAPGLYYVGLQMSDSKGVLRLGYTTQIEVVAAASAPMNARAVFSTSPIVPPLRPLSAVQNRQQRIIDLVANFIASDA